MKSVVILITYFGKWPPWLPVFLLSCRFNPSIDWCIYTDCTVPQNPPPNVKFIRTTFFDYCSQASQRLGVNFSPNSAYNLCNLKPMLGNIHGDLISPYNYFGWSDLDVIYGDIRATYTDEVLTKNVISSHASICSGHFTLLKNERWIRDAYMLLTTWRSRLEDPGPFEWHESLDEAHLSAIFSPDRRIRYKFGPKCLAARPSPIFWEDNYFVEQWSTPFVPGRWADDTDDHPETWFWREGVLTNSKSKSRLIPYLHLMNFKSKRWLHFNYRSSGTWDELQTVCHFDESEIIFAPNATSRFRIDRSGIHLSSS